MASSESLGALEHVGVVVADLGAATAFLTQVLGLTLEREAVVGDGALRTAFLAAGPVEVELIEIRDAEPRAERLGDARARIEHLAFRTSDLEAASDALRGHGIALRGGIGPGAGERAMEVGDSLNLFTVPETSLGLLLQIVQRGPARAS